MPDSQDAMDPVAGSILRRQREGNHQSSASILPGLYKKRLDVRSSNRSVRSRNGSAMGSPTS